MSRGRRLCEARSAHLVRRDIDRTPRCASADVGKEWNFSARRETPTARLERNWDDLLQELRASQMGVQLLTGLLLTVPFQARFGDLPPHQVVVYLVAVARAVLASGLLLRPVVLHRVPFRQPARRTLVSAGQRRTRCATPACRRCCTGSRPGPSILWGSRIRPWALTCSVRQLARSR